MCNDVFNLLLLFFVSFVMYIAIYTFIRHIFTNLNPLAIDKSKWFIWPINTKETPFRSAPPLSL